MRRVPLANIVIYLCAMAINGFDGTVVIPILPLMAEEFGVLAADLSGVEWAFLIASAAILPCAGWLSSWLGTARVFRIFLLGLGAGLLLSCCAHSVWVLILARVVQGISSGILVPVGLAMMYQNATGADRLRISQITLIPLTVAPMLGPVLGGFMAEHLGWRWIFGVLAALTLFTCLAACLMMRDSKEGQGSSGNVYRVGQLVTLTQEIWGSVIFRRASLAVSLTFGALNGFLFVVPVLLAAQGVGTQAIGFMMFPETLGLLVGGQLTTRLKNRVGARRLMLVGYSGASASMIAILFRAEADLLTALLMFCFSLFLSQPVLIGQAGAFYGVPPQSIDHATTVFIMLKTVLSAAGVMAVSALLTGFDIATPAGTGAVSVLLLILWAYCLALCYRIDSVLWNRATSAEE